MKKITIEWVKASGLLIYEAITGSRAYGLDTAKSDTDIRGIFILPENMFFGLEYTGQVNNETNDIVYYELKKFMELLAKSNPNILEMLNVPGNCVLYKHELMNMFEPGMFLSKQCGKTFANYAFTQIKKAYGLEKKIVNPVDKEKKSVEDFCFVHTDKEAIPLEKFSAEKGLAASNIGLSAISHMRDCYNLYYSVDKDYAGVAKKETANDVSLSTIPKEERPLGILYFNKDAYSIYCKTYREYWEWIEQRNDERYDTTISHGKNYDSKNMMHVFRLLLMAKEIATENRINVFRNDRDYLLSIKEGKFEYDELLQKAAEIKGSLPGLYQHSTLPEFPGVDAINELLVLMRQKYYGNKK